MLILDWKTTIDKNIQDDWNKNTLYSYPESIVATIIPINSPHVLNSLSSDTVRVIEAMQTMLLSGESDENEEVTLEESALALFLKKNTIISTFIPKQDRNLLIWCKKLKDWESTDKILVIDMLPKIIFPIYQKNELCIKFHIEISPKKDNLDNFVVSWGRNKNIHLREFHKSFENCLEASNLSLLLSLYHPEELVKVMKYQKNIRDKVEKVVRDEFGKQGLNAKIKKVDWKLSKEEDVSHNNTISLTKKIEFSIEQKRLHASLEDLKANSLKKDDSKGYSKLEEPNEVSTLDPKRKITKEIAQIAEKKEQKKREIHTDFMPLSKRIDDVKKEFHSQTSRDDVEKKTRKEKGKLQEPDIKYKKRS